MLEKIYQQAKTQMIKVIEAMNTELATIRTGRASISLLDHIRVEYYDAFMPVNQLATISIPEPKLILITPWDKKSVEPICKAILQSTLGLVPTTDGYVIRIPIPLLTEERRKELDKTVKKKAEDGRVAIRNIRREINAFIKKTEDNKTISEDESFKAHEHVQQITDEFISKIDHLLALKEKEILGG